METIFSWLGFYLTGETMGTWLRDLSNRKWWLKYRVTIRELNREYPELCPIGEKGKIPDPWDDYPRKDQSDRCWKRFRKTQYKSHRPKKTPTRRPKIVYDSPDIFLGRWACYYLEQFNGDFNAIRRELRHYSHRGRIVKYRVRLSYCKPKCTSKSNKDDV
jgi:hypothetical protein